MNFIIFVVGLTSFLHDSSQTGLITLQYDGILHLFDSIPRNQLTNYLKESLEKPGENICSLMSKSRTFNIETEPLLKYHKHNPILDPKLKQKVVKFRNQTPIESILKLHINPEDSKDDTSIVGLIKRRPEILPVTTCSLSHSTLCYISKGIEKNGVTMQFIFGKVDTSPIIPKLLAAISKPNVKLVKGMKFGNLLLKLNKTPTSTKEYFFDQWEKSSVNYFWISAAIADYECDNDRRNFNLRFPENGSIQSFSGLKVQNKTYIPNGTPIIRFGVEDRDTYQKIMTIVIIPNYFGDNKSTYFYGIEDDSGKFALKHCVTVTFQ